MKALFLFVIIAAFSSCSTDSSKLQQLEARQLQLEHRIDSLETALRTLERYSAATDSLLLEMLEPTSGSLLNELEY